MVHSHYAARFWGRTTSLVAAGLVTACVGFALPARASDEAPTFFVTASGGYSVYKSEMVQSNDTSTTIAYGFGVSAGANNTVGFILNREASTFTFALNDASMSFEWQDIHLRYRYGPVYLGAVISQSHWTVAAPPDEDGDDLLDQGADPVQYLDISSSGYGGNVGVRIPVVKRGEAYLDVTYTAAGTVRETAADPDEAAANGDAIPGTRDLGIGSRMDLDLGGSFRTSKWLSVICGFKSRTYQLTVESDTFAESHSTTYVGVNAGWSF